MKEKKRVVVTEIHRGEIISFLDNKRVKIKVPGSVLHKEKTERSPVAVGDLINIYFDSKSKSYIFESREERRNQISRRDPFLTHISQVIASNIDFLGVVTSLKNPDIQWELIDRYLITADKYEIPPIIVFNKADLVDNEFIESLPLKPYRDMNIPIFFTSATNKTGFDSLKELIKNSITLFSGTSGVGKSTIVNLMEPDLPQKVGDISEKGARGTHTTRSTRLIPLKNGGYIIDSPGIYGFGLDSITDIDIKKHYEEFYPFLSGCKYPNCTHTHENQCGVKEAYLNGKIEQIRFENYINILTNPTKFIEEE
ncbi:ribosome small subunit-dependent GTPase A [bacterium]|nr:ribosome small subunit-dependent GTPase A [bacterium]